MNFNLPDIQILRNNIDFCSIAQFFHTFATAFGPWPSTAQDIIYARHTEPNNDYVFETEVKGYIVYVKCVQQLIPIFWFS